jgi:hypothetical protein
VLDNGSAAIRIPIDCDDGGSARIFQLRFNSSNQPDFIPFNTGGSTFAATGSAAAPTIRPVLLLGRVSGTSVSVWLDGVQVGSNTLTGTAATVGQASTTVTIAAGHNGGSNFGGLIYLAGHAARAWSDAEIVSVSANPWQLFAPQQRRLWVGAAAGGARTISATPGAWNWAGTTSAPAVQTIAQTVGAFTWAGTTASIPTPSISQTPGAWNWAGTTANFNSITTISATPGAWTWAGTTASIPAQALSATPGAYSWAGTTSGIGVANIAATPGAWNWQGTTQGIIQLVTISASPGLWNWQGTQAGVTNPSASVTIRAGSWIRYRTI